MIRKLEDGDEEELEAFLQQTPGTSMHMRSNLKREGFARTGKRHQGLYYGAFDKAGRITGVIAHFWNGNILMQPGGHLEALLEALRQEQPEVHGLLGPAAAVRAAIKLLGLETWPMHISKDEDVYMLGLADLVVPQSLKDGALTISPVTQAERALAIKWRVAFNREALNAPDTPESRREVEQEIDAKIADGTLTLLVKDGAAVAMCGGDAALPDSVTVGPVWTVPGQRGKGYARAVVAGNLLSAREKGGTRSVLFTDNPAGIKAYKAVGFRQVDHYGLTLLARPFTLGPD